MTNAQLVKKLKVRVELVKEIDRAIGVDSKLVNGEFAEYPKEIDVDIDDAKTTRTIEAQRRAWEKYLAVILIYAAEHGQTGGKILQELRNDALKGQSMFPVILAKELAMVNDYSIMAPMKQTASGYKIVVFTQEEAGPENFKRRGKDASCDGDTTQHDNGKAREKSGVT